MSEEILVRQGAPTLAGIKTGSLFPCPCEDKEALFADIRRLNRLLVPKGLCLLPIRFLKGQVLLYLYRPSELRRDLENEQAAEILHHAGYNSGHCGRCIANLIRRFREGGEFPHEVGLFLSYPPEDVKGFIDHRACNFKCAALFGSYGWGDGEWMRGWEKDCDDSGIRLVCESVTCCEAPDDAALDACRALGKELAK